MKERFFTRERVNQEEERRCVSCGAPLVATHSSNGTWSLEFLLPAGVSIGTDMCPSCRQRHQARRIGAVVSAHV